MAIGELVLLVALLAGCTGTETDCVSREELNAVNQELEAVKDKLSGQEHNTGKLYLLDNPNNLTASLHYKLDLLSSQLQERDLSGHTHLPASCSELHDTQHPNTSGYYQLAPSGQPAYCDFELTSTSQPAASCDQIFSLHPSAPSGYYQVRGEQNASVEVYCDLGRECCGREGGWARVGYLDMTDPSQQCPDEFRFISAPTGSGRLCTRGQRNVSGCSSMTFKTNGMQYSRVCGRVIAYQHEAPDAFVRYTVNRSFTINDAYVDGVIITHGQPRQHIWTFAAAIDETSASENRCPCTKTDETYTGAIPPYVRNDYFCDTGSRDAAQNRYYEDDPLWDGQGCGPTSSCCRFNNPPWFCKALPQSTTDDIELRLCATFNPDLYNEDTPIELVEVFVQ